MAYLVHTSKKTGAKSEGKTASESRALKTAITVIAELVRSLVVSGLAAIGLVLAIGAASAVAGYGLWRMWQRARR